MDFWRRLDRRSGAHTPIRAHESVRLDPRPDRILAVLLAARTAESGAGAGIVKPIRERRPDEYPAGLENQLENKEAQAFLRNIPRVERELDDRLEFDHSRVVRRDWHDLVRAVHVIRREPLQLLDEMNLHRVSAYREETRRLFFESDWTRHFGAELARTIDGPLWRYDADAPKPDADAPEPDADAPEPA